MNITIVGRKCTLRDSFKARADKKLAKIEHFFGEDIEAKITATVEKSSQTVEITVTSGGLIFRAQQKADNMNDALDRCVDQLVRQIRKNKTKVEKRLKSGAFERYSDDADEHVADETSYEIVRRKVVALKPQSADEAVLQMNMLGHQFYMFLDEETDEVAVVYRRSDGGYGLIAPEFEG